MWPQRWELQPGAQGIVEDARAQGAVSLVVMSSWCPAPCWVAGRHRPAQQVLEPGLVPGEDGRGTPVAVSSTGHRLEVKRRLHN